MNDRNTGAGAASNSLGSRGNDTAIRAPTSDRRSYRLARWELTKNIADWYYFYASCHINTCVDAFIVLRRDHRVDGARLLVRPALETMFRLQAVRAKAHLFYRVCCAEALEIDKWFGGVAKRRGVAYTPVCDREEWREFKKRCASEFGAEKLEDTRSVHMAQLPRLAWNSTTIATTGLIASTCTERSKP